MNFLHIYGFFRLLFHPFVCRSGVLGFGILVLTVLFGVQGLKLFEFCAARLEACRLSATIHDEKIGGGGVPPVPPPRFLRPWGYQNAYLGNVADVVRLIFFLSFFFPNRARACACAISFYIPQAKKQTFASRACVRFLVETEIMVLRKIPRYVGKLAIKSPSTSGDLWNSLGLPPQTTSLGFRGHPCNHKLGYDIRCIPITATHKHNGR
jgi:hypothetical protein